MKIYGIPMCHSRKGKLKVLCTTSDFLFPECANYSATMQGNKDSHTLFMRVQIGITLKGNSAINFRNPKEGTYPVKK